MPHCSSLRQLEHRVDSQPLVERKLSASMVIGGHRWLLSLPSTAHTRTATPSKSRACCQPVWPSASKSRVASPRSQNLLWREDYARTVIGWPNHRPTWPVATVAPVDNAHCSGATSSKSRVAIPFGHPMWPAHVARICSGARIMLALLSVGRTTGQHGQWPLSMATVAPVDTLLRPRRARPGQAMWPAHVASPCGQPMWPESAPA
jgi:hypothetical protein